MLNIALHITQEQLPLSGPGSSQVHAPARSAGAAAQGSGSGYGPPLAASGTPLSQLVASTLYNEDRSKTEYDLVCVPLTNSSWQDRWERMCTLSTSATALDLGASAASHAETATLTAEDHTKREAEKWRAGGAFTRGEVNVTRSGQSLLRDIEIPQPDSHFSFDVAEEAGSLILLASEWLELDSPAEGIRFDSELVRRPQTRRPLCSFSILGSPTRSRLRFVPLCHHHHSPATTTGESRISRRLRKSCQLRFGE